MKTLAAATILLLALASAGASEATLRPMPRPHMEPVIAPVKQETPPAQTPPIGEPTKPEPPLMKEPPPPPKKPDTWRIKRWWS
jgi:hypothetical protein